MELSRRELLRATAAAAVFGAGCARESSGAGNRAASAITGSIVGQDDARGHRLRNGVSASTASARESEIPLVIVGGGIAGLSAAWTFARAGVRDFALFELEDEHGGTSRAGRGSYSAHPWGAHYLPIPTREQRTACALLADMGVLRGFDERGTAVVAEEHRLRAPAERLFWAGEWSEGLFLEAGASAADLGQLARFEAQVRELAARRDDEGLRWFTLPLAQGSRCADVLALDALSMAQWLDLHEFHSSRLRWYVEYACRDDFGAKLEQVSAFAALHYFAARGRDDESTHYLTWPEGNARLARHLARALGADSRAAALVTELEPLADHVRVTWWDARANEARVTRAQHVICAVPRLVARRIVRELASETSALEYSPWVVAHLELSRAPASRGHPQCWDNVLYESESLGYVVDTHQLDRSELGQGWTWYRPFCDADPRAARTAVLGRDWSSWRDEVLRDLAPAHVDLEELVESIDVWRWGHAMIRPRPGFLASRTRGELPARLGRIAFAGCDLGGLPLFEEAQWSGVRAAESLLAERGVSFESCL